MGEDDAELAPFVEVGGWHEIRPHIPSATTIRTMKLRTIRNLLIQPTMAPSASHSC